MAYELKTLCIDDFCRSVLEYVQGQNIEFTKVGGKVTISADLSDYLTAEQIYDLIGEIGGISIQKVDVLPPTGESNVIYLVPKNPSDEDNIFDEYVYVDGDWEKIGDTSVDLSNYYTKSETDALIPTKTSDLTNDSDFVSDADYVHTDNNFTSADKTKLNSIASGAQVNQNAFSAVKVGAQTIYADTTTDTVELEAGANVILTVDTANDKITIEARDTTYGEATTTTAGLMSPNDLVKLDSIEFGATVDDKTWDGVQLDNSQVVNNAGTTYVPHTIGSVTSATANMTEASATPSGAVIAKWDTNSQLHSASPLITDTPSDVVATTEYVINQVSGKANVADIPTATSQLTNDSNFVSDANYVHTDNNFTTTLKNKLDGIEAGAEVNVQADWNQTDTTADAYIKNKPSIPTNTSQLTNDSDFVVDANYVHTDNNFTTADKTKLDGIEDNAEVNVQSDWNQTDSTADDFIKNKPTIPTATSQLTNDSDFVVDANYVHTDNNFTTTLKNSVGKWNGVSLTRSISSTSAAIVVPYATSASATTAKYTYASATPTANYIAKYDATKHLYSVTTDVADSSTRVATTAFVKNKIDSVGTIIEAYPVGSTPLASDWLSESSGGSALTPSAGDLYIILEDDGKYRKNQMFRWDGTSYVQLSVNGGAECYQTADTATHIGRIDMARCGNIVTIKIQNLKSLSAGNNANIYHLGNDYAPLFDVFGDPSNPQRTYQLRLTIRSDGYIDVYNYSSATPSDTNAGLTLSYIWKDASTAGTQEAADVVIETGTSGIWTYRKWSNGISECWGQVPITTPTNGAYVTAFPSGLFSWSPMVTETLWYGSGSDPHRGARAVAITDGSDATNCIMYIRVPNGTEYGTIHSGYFAANVTAHGRWK